MNNSTALRPIVYSAALPAVFQPTAAQRRLLDYVRANPGHQTVRELCAAAQVDPASYYRWCQDPAFRAWFGAEWSTCVLFEGWHMLNLARANMTRSPTHFRALFSLVFDPRGQAALANWQKRLAPEIALAPENVASDLSLNQSLASENASFSPTRVIRHLDQAIDQASQDASSE